MMITLDKIKKGQKCQVVSINIENKEKRRHLLDMGLTRGTEVKVKQVAPMGDPVSLELRGYILNVSKNDLKQIIVRKGNL